MGIAKPGYAATIALAAASTSGEGPTASPRPSPTTSLGRARESVSYVFATLRGRLDAEERRRALTGEREDAMRALKATLVEAGQTVLAQAIWTPELEEPCGAATRAKQRREGVILDLAAAEKLQASEDLRLGLLEAAIETECAAYERSVADVELTLADNESRRLALVEGLAARGESPDRAWSSEEPRPARSEEDQYLAVLRRRATQRTGPAAGQATWSDFRHGLLGSAGAVREPGGASRASPAAEKVRLDDQHRALLDRASALRASSLAAQARLEQAKATRKRTTAAMAASVAGHTRERATIDEESQSLAARIGARAVEIRVPSPFLATSYERFDRLQAAMRTHAAELARLERSKRGLDRKKLALGVGVIVVGLGIVSAGLWVLLR